MTIDYEKDTAGNIEDMQEDDEVKPAKYINNTIIKIEEALSSPDKDNILRSVMLIEHLEVLARTSHILDDDTVLKLDEISKIETKNEIEIYRKSNEKLKLILSKAFSYGKTDTPLKA